MFGKKKEKEECIRICLNGVEIYRGTMTDLPLKEEIILGKSDEFFNYPNLCFNGDNTENTIFDLEQSLQKAQKELEEAEKQENWELWNRYAAFPGVDSVERI